MYVCNNIVYMLSLNKNTIINLPEQQKKNNLYCHNKNNPMPFWSKSSESLCQMSSV